MFALNQLKNKTMKNENKALSLAIVALEQKQNLELEALKNQFFEASESLKPINIIKSTFKEITSSSEIKNSILENAIGIGMGLFAKKILLANSMSVSRNIYGSIVQFIITNVVSNEAGGVKNKVENWIYSYLSHRKDLKKSE